MIRKKSKNNSLSDKISDLLKAPDLQDPEDDIYEETKAKTVEADSDFENDDGLDNILSSFRKQNAKLLQDVDKKYVGKAVSRKSLGFDGHESEVSYEEDSESSEHVKSNIDNDDVESSNSVLGEQYYNSDNDEQSDVENENSRLEESEHELSEKSDVSENNESGGSDNESEDSDNESDFDGDVGITDFDDTKEETTDFKHVKGANASESVQKGNAVRQQLHIWEKLMEMRIHTQKILLTANKLPRYHEYEKFVTPDFNNTANESKKLLSNLLNKFLDVQELLLLNYPETKDLNKTQKNSELKNDSDEEIPSDTEEEKSDEEIDEAPRKKRKLSDFPNVLSERHDSYVNYRNSVIQKWHDKVRVASGVNKHLSANSLIKHIEFILSDKEKLRKRTQLKRSKYDILTLNKPHTEKSTENSVNHNEEQQMNVVVDKKHLDDEYDTEIFDDDDFYHQLLREFIEYKTANVSDPVQLSKQWIELQQLRNKMKRKIDTKATKGRRIRYTVHSKLVNFMAPEDNSTWTEEAKDELFGSVFGGKTKTENC